jgi:hypothetical protein
MRVKPTGIPAAAFFDEGDQAWAVGAIDSGGRKIGSWRYWRDDGTEEGAEEWGDGLTRMTYQRFHLDGSIAQSGAKNLRNGAWVGPMVWTRLSVPSVEDRFWPAAAPANAHRFEKHFDESGRSTTVRVFDLDGNRITGAGNPFPLRPESVDDEEASLIDNDARWFSGATSFDSTQGFGVHRIWDRNGTLLERRHYGDDGVLRRQETFKAEGLWSTREYPVPGELVQSFYRVRDGVAVLSSQTHYKNEQKDRRSTYFDATGQALYSVRMEEVAPGHVRRYDNDVLVFEGEWDKENRWPPRVRYFDGPAVLVDYVPGGDNTGVFRLFGSDGTVIATLAVNDEKDLSEYGHWSRFLPGFARYDSRRTLTDVEAVRADFIDEADEERFSAAVDAVRVPDAWSVIHDVKWSKSRAAHKAPFAKLLVLMLGDDPVVAERAAGRVWAAIEEQDCLFDATYDVALTLTRLLPALSSTAELLRRAVRELTKIMLLPAMPHEQPKRYAEVIVAVGAQREVLARIAATSDDDDGRAALWVLATLGHRAPVASALVDKAKSAATRAFAACLLAGPLAAASSGAAKEKAQRPASLATLRAALAQEADEPARVVVGVCCALLTPDAGTGDAANDALLVAWLQQPAPRAALHDVWRVVVPFLGDDIGAALFRAVPPTTRMRYVEQVIGAIATRNMLEQVDDLDLIFMTLFGDGADTPLTPLHQVALRAVADVVDKHPGFVNHAEVFRKYGLPWDSFKLRELAAGALTKTASQASSKTASSKTASTKKASPKKASTKKASPKKASPKKASTKKASTKKASTKKASTKKASTKKASQR